MKIVQKELAKKDVFVDEDILKKITEKIMNISYAKGGDSSDKIIQSYARTYIEREQYKKYLSK